MLTKDDLKLFEKSTRKIVREEIEVEGKNTREELSYDIRTVWIELSNRIDAVGSRVKNLEIATNNLQKDMTVVKKDVKYLKKELKFQSNILDKENIKTLKRVKVIEESLKISTPDFV